MVLEMIIPEAEQKILELFVTDLMLMNNLYLRNQKQKPMDPGYLPTKTG